MNRPFSNRSFACAVAAVSVALPATAIAASAADCQALASLALPQTRITSATWNPATASLPEHCRVQGIIGPGTIGFAVQLPTDWNGKLYHGGGGGFVGAIPDASAGLVLHYATTATDTGHTGGGLDASWALNNPQAVVDFGYRAVHVTTTTAKSILAAYYRRAARRSYFVGCSRGGGQGLMEAQRFPDDFDGIVVGAPAFNWTEFMMGFNWNSRAVAAGPNGSRAGGAAIPAAKLPVIEQAVLKQCDASDGLVDRLVTDPRACSFDPAVLRCQGPDAPTCLTGAQVEAVREVYGGPVSSSGRRITLGFPAGAESNGGWDAWISGGSINPPLQFSFQDGFFRYIVFNNPAYDPYTFNFDTDPPKLVRTGLILNATDPDLRPFKKGGSKIVMYHGWTDHALSALKTIQYYEQVGREMNGGDDEGGAGVQGFFRFFLVPDMHHCGGGPGPNTFDAFAALVAWVEQGKAPERIIASGGAVPGRTRPLCPYPKQAVYKGTGSIDDAASFACAQAAKRGGEGGDD